MVIGVTCCENGDRSALVADGDGDGDEDDGAERGGGVVHVVGFGGGDGACWIGRCPDECASTPRIAPATNAGPAGMSLPRSLCRAQTMQPTSSRRTWAVRMPMYRLAHELPPSHTPSPAQCLMSPRFDVTERVGPWVEQSGTQ